MTIELGAFLRTTLPLGMGALDTDIAALNEKFAPYRERFGIDSEQKH
jgi:hypothetical protein